MKYILSLLSLVCLLGFSWTVFSISLSRPYKYEAKIIETLDGDTFKVQIKDSQGLHTEFVRIVNVDCEEKWTARGDAITKAFDKIFTGNTMQLRTYWRGYYKRILGDFMFSNGKTLSSILLDYNICPPYDQPQK